MYIPNVSQDFESKESVTEQAYRLEKALVINLMHVSKGLILMALVYGYIIIMNNREKLYNQCMNFEYIYIYIVTDMYSW